MIKPLGTRVVIQPDEPVKVSMGGIHLVGEQSNDIYGQVLAIGVDVKSLQVGDKILYVGYGRTTELPDGNKVLIVKEEDISAEL